MDAHQVLGLPLAATLDDAEDAYKRLLRVHHPDLHQHEGPGPLAAAELRTAALNAAIDQFRRVAASGAAISTERFDPKIWDEPAEDDRPQVRCPLCDEWFTTAPALKQHVATDHEMRLDRTRRRLRRRRAGSWPIGFFAPANALVALVAGVGASRVLGSAMLAVWVMALTMAPSAIRLLGSDT
jgi:uncharacterized C2H2 Zn-finger protein